MEKYYYCNDEKSFIESQDLLISLGKRWKYLPSFSTKINIKEYEFPIQIIENENSELTWRNIYSNK